MESEIKALEVAVVIPGTMAIRDVQKQILPYHIIEIEMNVLKERQRALHTTSNPECQGG